MARGQVHRSKEHHEAIAAAAKLNEMEIRRIVYGLMQAGLVEMVRPSTAPLPLNPKMFPTKDQRRTERPDQ